MPHAVVAVASAAPLADDDRSELVRGEEAEREVGRDRARSGEIGRGRARSVEVGRDRTRSVEIGRGRARSGESSREQSRSPCAWRGSRTQCPIRPASPQPREAGSSSAGRRRGHLRRDRRRFGEDERRRSAQIGGDSGKMSGADRRRSVQIGADRCRSVQIGSASGLRGRLCSGRQHQATRIASAAQGGIAECTAVTRRSSEG